MDIEEQIKRSEELLKEHSKLRQEARDSVRKLCAEEKEHKARMHALEAVEAAFEANGKEVTND